MFALKGNVISNLWPADINITVTVVLSEVIWPNHNTLKSYSVSVLLVLGQ